MARMPVMPRDVQAGDLIDQMGPDLSVVPVKIVEVEKVRVAGRTAYRLHLDGDRKPVTVNPGHPLTIERRD